MTEKSPKSSVQAQRKETQTSVRSPRTQAQLKPGLAVGTTLWPPGKTHKSTAEAQLTVSVPSLTLGYTVGH